MKSILKFLAKPFLGKRILQPLFRGMVFLGLKGMNIGGGSTFSESGEEWVLEFLVKDSRNFVLFDGGANRGGYALMAESVFSRKKATGVVYCFEPSEKTYAFLKQAGEGHNSIISTNAGLGSEIGQVTLHSDREGSGLASVYDRDLQGAKLSQTETINMTTVDEFCGKYGIEHIDLLKLDIEGHELSALKGAGRMLSEGKIKAVQFEFGGADIDARVFLRDFFHALSGQFKMYRILQNGLEELPCYSEWYEIFVTTNYLAIKK